MRASCYSKSTESECKVVVVCRCKRQRTAIYIFDSHTALQITAGVKILKFLGNGNKQTTKIILKTKTRLYIKM